MDAAATGRELEWYLRDHLFREHNKTGRTQFEKASLPSEMVELYLRYRGADPRQLSETMKPVVEHLVIRKVLRQTSSSGGDSLELESRLVSLQCAKCFYICYLGEKEPQQCLRCPSTELHEFPKKKAVRQDGNNNRRLQ